MNRIQRVFLSGLLQAGFVLSQVPAQANSDSRIMEIFATAIKYSAQLQSLVHSRDALQHEIRGLQAQRWVNLDMTLSGGNSFSTTQANTNLQTNLQMNNTFDIANKIGFDIQRKEYEMLKNRYQANLLRKNLFQLLASQYYHLCFTSWKKEVHQKSIDQLQTQLLMMDQGVRLGKFAAMDRDRLRVEILNQQVLLANDQLEIVQALQQIHQLSGLDLSQEHFPGIEQATLDDSLMNPLDPSHLNVDQLTQSFLQTSPELQMLVLDKLSEEVHQHQIEASWYPDLKVSQNYQLNTLTPSPEAMQQTTANLHFQFLDGARGPEVTASEDRIKALELDYVDLERSLATQFYNNWSELTSRYRQHQLLEQALTQARSNRERLLAGYQRQFSDLTTLLSASRDWLSLEASVLDNLAQYHISQAILQHQSQGDIFE